MESGTAGGKCSICTKYLLVVFNIFFCFIGAGLVIVGTYAYIQFKDFEHFFGDINIYAPAIVLILFGCITFIVAGIGCLGAFKESPCLLFAFATFIGLVLGAEVICGGIAFIFRKDLQEVVVEQAAILLTTYNESTEGYIKDAWDTTHVELKCCGASGRSDWKNASVAKLQNQIVPKSCQNYTIGCVDKFVEKAYENVALLGVVAFTFGAIQVIGIVLACILGCSAKKGLES